MSHPQNDIFIDNLRDKLDEEMGEAATRRMTNKGIKGRQVRPHRVIEVPRGYRKAQHLFNLSRWITKRMNERFDDYFFLSDKDFDKLEKEYLKKV